jgi:hypothetical protein
MQKGRETNIQKYPSNHPTPSRTGSSCLQGGCHSRCCRHTPRAPGACFRNAEGEGKNIQKYPGNHLTPSRTGSSCLQGGCHSRCHRHTPRACFPPATRGKYISENYTPRPDPRLKRNVFDTGITRPQIEWGPPA